MENKSVYIKNNSNRAVEIIYDDRFYRSQLDTTRTLTKLMLEKDSTFYIGADSSISSIWPDFIQINSSADTIILIGRGAIKSMINETNKNELHITIR